MHEYPFLDQMMAETLVHAYENGTLQEGECEDPPPPGPAPPPVLQNISISDTPPPTK